MISGVQVGGGGDQVNFMPDSPSASTANSSGANTFVGFQPASNNSPYQADAPYYGGTIPSPAAQQYAPAQLSQPGYAIPSQQAPAAPVTPPPPHHSFSEFMPGGSSFGQLVSDPAYAQQKAALLGKLNDYERNIAGQIGSQNLTAVTNSPDALTGPVYGYNGKALGANDLFKDNKDVNGDDNFVSAGSMAGGTLGKQYDTALANFNNQQAQGLRNTAEDFAARGMLGSGSGVWQTARNNLQDQYRNQLTNINDSTVGQYNSLLGNLADQFSQGRNTLQGYATDASNRIATNLNAGLPTSV